MAKLLIFRGETLHREVELTEQTVRIGRTSQNEPNEIVLEDPSKGVSRTHAEIRLEGDRYVLVDLKSQNGIWVSGSRVSTVVLDPGVVAGVGPFRLTLEGSVPAPSAYAPDMPTEFTSLPELPPEPLPPVAQSQTSAPPTQRERTPSPPKVRPWYEQPRTWLIGGAAALLIVALGFAAVGVLQRTTPAFDLELARAMVDGGNCRQALAEHIDPALNASPDDREALELKRRCTMPSPPEPPPPEPVPTHDQELDDAQALIAANDCATALEKVNAVLADDPTNERATNLLGAANACLTPEPPVQPKPQATDALAVRESPSQGGLDLLPKELAKDYQKRKLAMRKRYDDAVSLLQQQEYAQAAREFDEILQLVPDGYLDLAERRAEAHAGIKAAVAKLLDRAQEAERAGDYDAALEAYGRAHEMDPSLDVDGPTRRIQEQKRQRGEKRCQEGKLSFSYGENAAAVEAFQDVVKLLPAPHPCYAVARDHLRRLGK